MIILQAEFIGSNSDGLIPFTKTGVYNLRLDIRGSAFSTDDKYHHIGPVYIQLNSGKFPDYFRKQFEYEEIKYFLEDWQVVKINLIDSNLPKYDLRKVKSLLFENMRSHKLNQLI